MATPWFDSAVAQIGKLHDGADVVRLAQEIAAKQPEQASYWKDAGPTTPWCGVFIAWNLVMAGIVLPGPRNGVGAMFVDWWLDYGTAVPVGQEQPGDLALWLGNPHHISFVAGNGEYVGGNQSDAVTRGHYRTPDAIRRPPSPIVAQQPHAARFTGITATVFAGNSEMQKSAYDGHVIGEDELGVSLPARLSGDRPLVRVYANGRTALAPVIDVGPWNTRDPYWIEGTRPQAETGTDLTGRKTNHAGIDLTPATARALGIEGKGIVDWEFVVTDATTATPMPTPRAPTPFEREVMAFQAAHPPLDVDGEVGPETWAAMMAASKEPATQPPVNASQIDIGKWIQFIENHRDDARNIIDLGLTVFNRKPDGQIAVPSVPATASSPPIHTTPAFQLGTIGAVATVAAHYIWQIDPNLTILAGAVSLGTAFLGPTGSIVGNIMMTVARGLVKSAQSQPPAK